jgi:sn1-specific diacylglycerol lipase
MRKTLEANMQTSSLFPPGRVWWALRDGDLHPGNRTSENSVKGKEKVRLFEVLDVEKVFSQIIFATDMLRFVVP